jgi:nucleoside-triphosphatase THEP1
VVNIETGEKTIFLRQNKESGSEKIGRFTISPEGLAVGRAVLHSLIMKENSIVIVDEVGLLELKDRGWSEGISELLKTPAKNIILTVRNTFVNEVKIKFDISEALIFNISETDYQDAGRIILESFKGLS